MMNHLCFGTYAYSVGEVALRHSLVFVVALGRYFVFREPSVAPFFVALRAYLWPLFGFFARAKAVVLGVGILVSVSE